VCLLQFHEPLEWSPPPPSLPSVRPCPDSRSPDSEFIDEWFPCSHGPQRGLLEGEGHHPFTFSWKVARAFFVEFAAEWPGSHFVSVFFLLLFPVTSCLCPCSTPLRAPSFKTVHLPSCGLWFFSHHAVRRAFLPVLRSFSGERLCVELKRGLSARSPHSHQALLFPRLCPIVGPGDLDRRIFRPAFYSKTISPLRHSAPG